MRACPCLHVGICTEQADHNMCAEGLVPGRWGRVTWSHSAHTSQGLVGGVGPGGDCGRAADTLAPDSLTWE